MEQNIQQELLDILACPRCRGVLETEGSPMEGLSCKSCALVYPIREGIPVMLLDEAVPLAEWRSKAAYSRKVKV